MEQKLKQILSNLFELEEDEITDESSIHSIENWDSLKHINMIIAIEEEFGISIDEEEMVEMTSFVDIKRILRDRGVLKNNER